MRARRSLAYPELDGDLLVRFARAHEPQDLELAGGELPRRITAWIRAERGDETACDRRIDLELAAMSSADGSNDLVGVGVLQQVPGRAGQ